MEGRGSFPELPKWNSLTPHDDSIHELVGCARRRFLINVALSQGVLAASVGMAGAILILLFGDQFLDWRWLALAAVVTFPLAYFRTARRVPAPYRVAQIVDDRLALKDSLSTALYFSELSEPDRRSSEDMRRAQRAASERLVSQVDPKIAVPLTAPRMLYVFGSLFLTAAVLFGVRYGIQRRMDLARPLTSVLMDAFGGGSFARRAALNKNKKSSLDIWGQTQVDSMSGAETQYKDGQDMKGQEVLDSAPDGVLNTVDVPEVDKGIADQKGDSKNQSDSKGGQGEAQSEEQDQSADAAKGPSSPKGGDPSGGSRPGDAASKQQGNNSGGSSLASKVKDALSNLMAAMRQKNPGQNGQSASQENGGDAKAQQQKAGQKGQGQGQKSNSDQQSDMGQPGDEGDGGKSADLKGGNQGDGPNGPDSGSGAGKQEGDKAAKLAEQAAAMGKISEIIGKRSANVTGEVTIEVTSSKQPLKTPYADGRASHGEAGGENNRDEVPAAFQEYVQQYFEQVRKPAQAAGKTPGTRQMPTGAPQAPTTSGAPPAH
jgi:hypothetical protein